MTKSRVIIVLTVASSFLISVTSCKRGTGLLTRSVSPDQSASRVVVPSELTQVPKSALEPVVFTGLQTNKRATPIPAGFEAAVTGITPDSPASKAGFVVGDVVLDFNDQETKTYEELEKARSRSGSKPGDIQRFRVQRGPETKEISLTVGGIAPEPKFRQAQYDLDLKPVGDTGFALKESAKGYLVSEVRKGTSAEKAGVRVGDLILTAGGIPYSPSELEAVSAGHTVKFEFLRDGKKVLVPVTLDYYPNERNGVPYKYFDPGIHGSPIRHVVYSPVRQSLISIDQSGVCKVWRSSDLSIQSTFVLPTGFGEVRRAALSRDGRMLVLKTTWGVRRSCFVIDLDKQNIVAFLPIDIVRTSKYNDEVAISADSRFVAYAQNIAPDKQHPSGSSNLLLYDLSASGVLNPANASTKSPVSFLKPHRISTLDWPVRGIGFSPKNPVFVTAEWGGFVKMWDAAAITQSSDSNNIAPIGAFSVFKDVPSLVHIMNVMTPDEVRKGWPEASQLNSLVWADQGNVIAIGTDDGDGRNGDFTYILNDRCQLQDMGKWDAKPAALSPNGSLLWHQSMTRDAGFISVSTIGNGDNLNLRIWPFYYKQRGAEYTNGLFVDELCRRLGFQGYGENISEADSKFFDVAGYPVKAFGGFPNLPPSIGDFIARTSHYGKVYAGSDFGWLYNSVVAIDQSTVVAPAQNSLSLQRVTLKPPNGSDLSMLPKLLSQRPFLRAVENGVQIWPEKDRVTIGGTPMLIDGSASPVAALERFYFQPSAGRYFFQRKQSMQEYFQGKQSEVALGIDLKTGNCTFEQKVPGDAVYSNEASRFQQVSGDIQRMWVEAKTPETAKSGTPLTSGTADPLALRQRLQEQPFRAPVTEEAYAKDPVAIWMEANFGFADLRTGSVKRTTSLPIEGGDGVIAKLAREAGISEDLAKRALDETLNAGYQIRKGNTRPRIAILDRQIPEHRACLEHHLATINEMNKIQSKDSKLERQLRDQKYRELIREYNLGIEPPGVIWIEGPLNLNFDEALRANNDPQKLVFGSSYKNGSREIGAFNPQTYKYRALVDDRDLDFWITSPDDKLLLYETGKGKIQVINTESGASLATITAFEDGAWFVAGSGGFFESDPRAAKRIGWRMNQDLGQLPRIYSSDQIFDFFNRRDIIAKSFQTGRSAEDIAQELGLKFELGAVLRGVPTVEIAGLKDGQEVGVSRIDVAVNAIDMGNGVEEIQLFQNDKRVPAAGPTRSRGGSANERLFSIVLSPGENTLRAVAFNRNHVQSAPVTAKVRFNGVKAQATLRVLTAGLNHYQNPRYNLNYCTADVDAVGAALRGRGRGLFRDVVVDALRDDQVTRPNLEKAFKKLAETAEPQDVFVFMYAGHGTMSEPESGKDAEFFLVPYDVTQLYGNADQLTTKAISGKLLEEWSAKIPAQKQIMLLDTCQSGGMVNTFAVRGAAEERAVAQLARATGTVVIASTGTEQYATEFKELGHGVFTYVLLQALEKGEADANKDGRITIKELETYVNEKVPDLTQKYQGTAQYPNSYSRGQDFPVGTIR